MTAILVGYSFLGVGGAGANPGCNLVVNATQDYNSLIAALPATASNQSICFNPGAYKIPLSQTGKSNLLLWAPRGGVTFTANVAMQPGKGGGNAVVNLYKCTNIELRGLTVVNNHEYESTPLPDGETYNEDSRGVYIHDSKEIILASMTIRTRGKQGLYLDASDAQLSDSTVQAGYMEIVGYSSRLQAHHDQFIQNYGANPILALIDDHHPMVWSEGSSEITLENISAQFYSGVGLAVSEESDRNYASTCSSNNPLSCSAGADKIFVRGTTEMFTSDPVRRPLAWSATSPLHTGLFMEVTGSHPNTGILDFWRNPNRPNSPPPNLVCKNSDPASDTCPTDLPMDQAWHSVGGSSVARRDSSFLAMTEGRTSGYQAVSQSLTLPRGSSTSDGWVFSLQSSPFGPNPPGALAIRIQDSDSEIQAQGTLICPMTRAMASSTNKGILSADLLAHTEAEDGGYDCLLQVRPNQTRPGSHLRLMMELISAKGSVRFKGDPLSGARIRAMRLFHLPAAIPPAFWPELTNN